MKTHSLIDKKSGKWNVWITNDDYETFQGVMTSQKKPSEEEIIKAYNSRPNTFRNLSYGDSDE
jgi:hypothetical protein